MRNSLVIPFLVFFLHSQVFAHHKAPEEETSKAAKASDDLPDFSYDTADISVPATLLDNPLWYDADIVIHNGQQWLTWLEYIPGKGDQIWIGQRNDTTWISKTRITDQPGEFARPTLTIDSNSKLWLSYEQLDKNQWDVFLQSLREGKPTGTPQNISRNAGTDINHNVAADFNGSLWFVWQSDKEEQFDVIARQFKSSNLGEPQIVGEHKAGDWHPQLAIDRNNSVHITWDAFDNDSFNVYLRSLINNKWGETRTIANNDAFEGRPQIAVDQQSRLWIAWEEGGKNWGKPFRGINTESLRDHHGPLHRFRELKLAVIDENNTKSRLVDSLPLPSIEQARNRDGRHEGIERTGAFYERAELTIDRAGRPWIVYRHNYTPWLSIAHRTHIEQGWGVYARCYGKQGWSELYKMQIGQGDGLQRLSLFSTQQGISAVWTTGRTHRDRNKKPRGIATAKIYLEGSSNKHLNLSQFEQSLSNISEPAKRATNSKEDNQPYRLFYGDLHRHTDLSLCRVPVDGTIDDAYRYAIEVAQLDFLGITDHSRDIAEGDPLSQLWWRSRKEVERHHLGSSFIPFFAYERSHSNTADHNVISLRGDMLRPHTYPLPDFWAELDRDTITIAHQPIRRDTWNYQEDEFRPLAEIFQGCRDKSIEEDIHRGLARGYHFGFIASSDHMSTSASYACVWAEEATRESIFRAMQARRTFGATDKIHLKVTAKNHWMGEFFVAEKMPKLEFKAIGTANISKIYLIVDGTIQETFTPGNQLVEFSHQLELTGKHYVYFHLVQADGNEAWSSPIWVNIESTDHSSNSNQ